MTSFCWPRNYRSWWNRGSPRPSQLHIQPTYQRWQDQGDGERRHSMPYTHLELTTGAGGYIIKVRTLGHWLQKMVSVRQNSIQRAGDQGAALQKIWKSHSIPISTKIWLMKALVWPVAVYGCEIWTLRKNEETRLDAFEMTGLTRLCGFHGQQRKQMSGFLTKLE